MKRLAVGKKWVDSIGPTEVWSLKAKRRAGQIVEATPIPDPKEVGGYRGGPGGRKGTPPAPRSDIRKQLGISESESHSWQALARIPEPIFDKFVEIALSGRARIDDDLDYAALQ